MRWITFILPEYTTPKILESLERLKCWKGICEALCPKFTIKPLPHPLAHQSGSVDRQPNPGRRQVASCLNSTAACLNSKAACLNSTAACDCDSDCALIQCPHVLNGSLPELNPHFEFR